jgi:hypothetical protein
MNEGIRAIHELAQIGYRIWVEGPHIRLQYEREGEPEPEKVNPLMGLVKHHKDEVLFFLQCYCPRCGGVVTCPDYEGRLLCLGCDWDRLVELYPGMAVIKN